MLKAKIISENREVNLLVADNCFKRALGLGFRKYVFDIGMYFKLNKKTKPIIWNFGMRFPITIAWLHEGKIISLSSLPGMSKGLKVIFAPVECDAFVEVDEMSFRKEDIECATISINEE